MPIPPKIYRISQIIRIAQNIKPSQLLIMREVAR